MKTYHALIQEVRSWIVTVEADNNEEAQERAYDKSDFQTIDELFPVHYGPRTCIVMEEPSK